VDKSEDDVRRGIINNVQRVLIRREHFDASAPLEAISDIIDNFFPDEDEFLGPWRSHQHRDRGKDEMLTPTLLMHLDSDALQDVVILGPLGADASSPDVKLDVLCTGGPFPPIGNALQFVMNALIYSEAVGKKRVFVGGKINATLAPLLNFGNGFIDVQEHHPNNSKVFSNCGVGLGSNWYGCKVPLRVRRAVALRYLTPRLRPASCVHHSGPRRLAIHLRSNERCCDNPTYVQPPCAFYDEVLRYGKFSEATVYGDPTSQKLVNHSDSNSWANPCMKDLFVRSSTPLVSGARISVSRGTLLSDICEIISATDLVLASSTFSTNLALLNPGTSRLFVPLPCDGERGTCAFESNKFYGLLGDDRSQNVSRFMAELREIFPDSVGYRMPTAYMAAAKIRKQGELIARSDFEHIYGRWQPA